MPKRTPIRPASAPKATDLPAFRIDDDLKAFIESGVGALVATGDAERRPHVIYAWGPRVREGRSVIDVFIEVARGAQTLANVRATGHMALTVGDPVSMRSLQFKGMFIDEGAASEEDAAWVQRHRDAFLVAMSLVGEPPGRIRGMWMYPVTRIAVRVERAFDQTPGPDAGRPL